MLNAQRALVTGSSRGIGLAVACLYLENGAAVVLTSEHPLAELPEVCSLLARFTAQAHYIQADLTHDGEAGRLVERAWTALGGVDILVNNLGTFREPDFLSTTRSDFERIFTINVWSAIAVTQSVVRRSTSGGRILFSSSLNGTRSEPAHTLYDASKGAIDALTRQLAVELAPLGFTTAAVAPGLVETPLTDFGLRSDPAAREEVIRQIPLRRIATVDDVAAWYLFLASPASRYATGIVIPVDGGLDAQQMATRPITELERIG